MRDKILLGAREMFLNFGFKSITMDDIAQSMGISKKTIYTHFNNKSDLINSVTEDLFNTICTGIDLIHEQQKNPIIELFEIKKFVMKNLNNEKSSPQYQLQKYYPKTFKWLKEQQFNVMQSCIEENLQLGIEKGFYRENIDFDFITRIYFHGLNGVRDNDIFPLPNYPVLKLMNQYLEYHLRGICTEKGIKELEKQLHTSKT